MSTHSKTVAKEIRGEWDGLKLVLFCQVELAVTLEKNMPYREDFSHSSAMLLNIQDIMQDHYSYDFHMTEASRKLFIEKYGPGVEDKLDCDREISGLFDEIEAGLSDD